MSFAWLGTFRQGQWRRYREFVLAERRDASARITTIQAELARIGNVTVTYEVADNGQVTEKRTGLLIDPPESSLGKLMAAYTSLGGNPLDISMFLMPDQVQLTADGETVETQPSRGVLYPLEGEYKFDGDQFPQGAPSLQTFDWRRLGGRRSLDDRDVGDLVDLSRRWISQSIKFKRNDIEARILKLCDLREQLVAELNQIAWMVGDIIPITASSYAGGRGLDQRLTVTQIVKSIDSVWYDFDVDNVPDFTTSSKNLGFYPNLMTDLPGGIEDNTAV